MRFKTFKTLAIVGAVGVGVAGLYGLTRLGGGSEPGANEPVTAPVTRPVAAVEPVAAPVAATGTEVGAAAEASPDALRPMDREILARVAEGISGDKAKDAVRGRAWKVNLYQDAGQSRVNRLNLHIKRVVVIYDIPHPTNPKQLSFFGRQQ